MPRPNLNKYEFVDDFVKIITTKGQVILIDLDDFENCKTISWHVDSVGYPSGSHLCEKIRLHRYIMNPPKGLQVDHINRDKLDNRKSNLRIVTHQENHFNMPLNRNNKSGHKGVHFNRECNKWCCQLTINGKCVYSALYEDIDDAIKKREELESIYFTVKPNH